MVKIIIDNEAKQSLKEAYKYIKKDSLLNAEKVRGDILSSIKNLSENPERHYPDKYKNNNDGSFRAYEVHNYRISYHIRIQKSK